MKLPYFYLNLYEIGVSEYHLKIIWKNHRKSIKCSHTRSEWFHIFSTDEGIASISYNPAVYVYEIFIYSSYTFIYFATVHCNRDHGHFSTLIWYIFNRAYRKAGYLTMVIAGYIPANSQLAAAIATIVKSLSIGK